MGGLAFEVDGTDPLSVNQRIIKMFVLPGSQVENISRLLSPLLSVFNNLVNKPAFCFCFPRFPS